MSSVAQIEANRRNAQRSTGPRTPEGKAASCRNAVTHGLLSAEALLAGESGEELEAFRRELLDALRPRGAAERLLADRFIAQAWRLRRAMRSEKRALGEGPTGGGPLEEALAAPAPPLDVLGRYEGSIQRGFYAALRGLTALQKDRRRREREAMGE